MLVLITTHRRRAQMSSNFYNRLAPFYHLLYGDWDAAVRNQGEALAQLLKGWGVGPGEPVLDAACGIGTQTLGGVFSNRLGPVGRCSRKVAAGTGRTGLVSRGVGACMGADSTTQWLAEQVSTCFRRYELQAATAECAAAQSRR